MTEGVLGGLIFVAVLAGMILIHEFGHFLAARLFKIEVEEFGIGFPPRALKLFAWKGTAFTLNWIPLGGFVRPKGENDPNVPGGLAAANPWKRLAVLFAGPLMNLLTGVLVYSILFTQNGFPDKVVIDEVNSPSPAERAGLQPGDVIVKVGGREIHAWEELQSFTYAHLGQPIQITYQRGDQIQEVTLVPRPNPPEGEGPIGVVITNYYKPASSWFATLPYSAKFTYYGIRELLALPGRILAGALGPEDAQIIGPRSIWNLFQQAVARDIQSRQITPGESPEEAPTNYTLGLIISLTLTLGVLNLLPIPALDGGRIFFTLPEILLRRRIPARFENLAHGIGLIVLIALLGYFYVMDFFHPVNIPLP